MANIEISKALLIDHHAHALREHFLQLDAIGMRQAFSESHSISQIRDHVPFTISYRDMLVKLGRLLDVDGEESLIGLRDKMREGDYVDLLFDDASICAFIIDDGLSNSLIALDQFSVLTDRPVFRCRRIEAAIEETLLSCDSFERLIEAFPKVVFDSDKHKIVSLKTIAAYRGGLEIDLVSSVQAAADFEQARSETIHQAKPRIVKGPLYHFLLLEAFDLAQRRGIPVQIHAGLGDQDQDIRFSNPACMRRVLQSQRFTRTKFMFLHCYPYVREAAHLCSIYPNVFMDISLATFLAASAVPTCFAEALAAAPFTKILTSTDGHSIPETHWYGAVSLRKGLSTALGQLVDDEYTDIGGAQEIAAAILHGNARQLYGLADQL